jgi:selenocysteine lyase/cysteine desulfurase
LIDADLEEVAVVRNTTEGVTLVAEGLPWRDGDNVVLPANEFPSNRLPWLNLASRGVEVRQVPVELGRLDLARMAAACDARTRIVAVSWVDYATGWRNDVDQLVELAHSRGALLFLDAIQGLGVFPLDVKASGVDFLAADGHKWLLGPEGAGLFYLKREHLDLLRPFGLGWNSVVHPRDYSDPNPQVQTSAARYEGGTWPMAGTVGLEQSLQLLSTCGVERLSRRVLEISALMCDRLQAVGATIVSDRSPARSSGIVAFELPGQDPAEVRKRCLADDVILSVRDGRLRASPHAYNNQEDVERLVEFVSRTLPVKTRR